MAIIPSQTTNAPHKAINHPVICFSDLPIDILMSIICFLGPDDILNLRKLSKSFYAITCERSVWIDSLRQECVLCDVYHPSFPMGAMSLNELEHAATACRRFSRRLRHEFAQRSSVAPHSVRLLEPSGPGEEFDNLRLVPGGRYLLSSNRSMLRLWDVGTGLAAPVNDPIASRNIDDDAAILSIRTRACASSSDALVFVSSSANNITYRLHVFSIFPSAAEPEFKLFAPILLLPVVDDECPGILGITSRHIAFATASTTVLWDFIQDTWISWPLEQTNWENSLYVCNNTIVIVHADRGEIYMAPMPALHPRGASVVPPKIDFLLIMHRYRLQRFNAPFEPLDLCVCGITLVFHGRETSTQAQSLYFDVVSEHDARVLVTHFALVPQTQTEQGGPGCALVALGESALQAEYRAAHSLHIEWLGRSVQGFVVEGRTLHVCLATMGINEAGAGAVSGVLATPGLPLDELNVDFCSFSGRVCARMPKEPDAAGGAGFNVVVMDYLAAKPTS